MIGRAKRVTPVILVVGVNNEVPKRHQSRVQTGPTSRYTRQLRNVARWFNCVAMKAQPVKLPPLRKPSNKAEHDLLNKPNKTHGFSHIYVLFHCFDADVAELRARVGSK